MPLKSRYSADFFLFLSTLFIRFPFFFRDYIDQDESTFLLMGQSIANGHLPYTHLWDLKPPLLFYFFALIEKLFPHSFIAIRFFGVLIVFASALLLMKIAKQAKLKNGFIMAVGYVILSSEFGSLQGVMSEHFAVFFILLGFLFFIKQGPSLHLFVSGLSFGGAILCKLNYGYGMALIIIIFIVHLIKQRKLQQGLYKVVLLCLGVLIPFLLISLPYVFTDQWTLFFNSVFLAPLEYGRAFQYTVADKIKETWWVLLAGIIVSWLSIQFSKEKQLLVYSLVALLAGTIYTFYSSGIVNGHYLVQVYPFFLLLIAGVIIQRNIKVRLIIAAMVIFLLSAESILEYYRVIKAEISYATPYTRPTFIAVKELKKRHLQNKKIFFADYHIGYWLLNQYPLTKSTTHPSNISRPFLFKYFGDSAKTSLEELKNLMEVVKPGVVVSKYQKLNFFAPNSEENRYFDSVLKKDFQSIYKDSINRVYIWNRTTITPLSQD